VVEFRFFPAFDLVAGFAFVAEAPDVNVLDGVTVVTGGWKALVDFTQVTIGARHAGVLALQRERGLRVVEGRHHGPLADLVAGLAFFAEIALVRLDLVVASKAGGWGFREFLALRVAADTVNLLV